MYNNPEIFNFSTTKSWHTHGVHIPCFIYSNFTRIPHHEQSWIFTNSTSFSEAAALHRYGRNTEKVFQFYEFDCICK